MPRGLTIKQLRKASAFVAGDLAAGQLGVNVADKRLAFSTDGVDVQAVVGANAGTIYSLIWNAAATGTNKYQMKDGSAKPSIGTFFYTGPTDPTTVGIIMNPGDEWRQTF